MVQLLPRIELASLLSIVFQLGMAAVARDKPAPPAADKPADLGEGEDLAKEAQNPVASLVSALLQNNTALGIGQYDRTQNVLNIQPVIPVRISDNWNLISRIIQPVVWQSDTAKDTQGWFGFGDMIPSFFFSPAKPHKLIWGAGPTFVLPVSKLIPHLPFTCGVLQCR
jgi:hypothetical protein